jgi:nucleoside-diphosphate-sugar epimerase
MRSEWCDVRELTRKAKGLRLVEDSVFIISLDALILVTGAGGFIGAKVVEYLLGYGFRNLRCFARPSSNSVKLDALIDQNRERAKIEILRGNLLSPEDCAAATKDVSVVYHLAAGRGEKLYADAFMNSVVTTRNLLEATLRHGCLKRFVNVSSFSVYSNRQRTPGGLLDETCPVELRPELRGDAYTFAKVKQDEILVEYGVKSGVPYVIVRPGYVYGPGRDGISNRVGIGTFGIFLHLGGGNTIPFTYLDNCADAIALAGLTPGIDGEVFNVVDDNLPSSREFLELYKKNVKRFRSIYVPHLISYFLCFLWERYSQWSHGQLPPAFNRRVWYAFWKKTRYSNEKLKSRLGWKAKVSSSDGLDRYFESCREKRQNA